MLEIAQTSYSQNYWHEDKSLLEFHWVSQEAQTMELEDFQEALLKYVALVTTYQPNFVLVNAEKLSFTIIPEVQEWVDENVNAVTNLIIKRMAVILPRTLIEQLSIEQVLDEKEAKKFESNFFSNYQEAFNWLTK
ncbi:MAG: hypothetical protein ACOVQA_09735 [Thermoflexibacteraceae bacterium]|jgi:hypothetical protein